VIVVVATVLGLLRLLRFFLSLFEVFVWKRFFLFSRLEKYLHHGEACWAVVTGASRGLGEAFARALGKRGFNLVLISRTREDLEEVSKKIREENPKIAVDIIVCDLARAKPEDWTIVSDKLQPLHITVLVNNAGLSYETPQEFLSLPEDRMEDIINLNILALTKMTRIVLNKMVTQKKGLILNVSSLSSLFPTPYLTVYGASKSYVNNFSVALAHEYNSKGIHVECVTPYFTVTRMSKIRSPSLSIPMPHTYVNGVLRHIGHLTLHAGYCVHDIIFWLVSMLPQSVLVNYTAKFHKRLMRIIESRKNREKKAQ
jgi:17beta-estradiol 17-dehydrogenase / very-long-chain 3-oxoacyl-CoA reductase